MQFWVWPNLSHQVAICASPYLSQVTTASEREILFLNMFNLSSKQIIGCIFVGKWFFRHENFSKEQTQLEPWCESKNIFNISFFIKNYFFLTINLLRRNFYFCPLWVYLKLLKCLESKSTYCQINAIIEV